MKVLFVDDELGVIINHSYVITVFNWFLLCLVQSDFYIYIFFLLVRLLTFPFIFIFYLLYYYKRSLLEHLLHSLSINL